MWSRSAHDDGSLKEIIDKFVFIKFKNSLLHFKRKKMVRPVTDWERMLAKCMPDKVLYIS